MKHAPFSPSYLTKLKGQESMYANGTPGRPIRVKFLPYLFFCLFFLLSSCEEYLDKYPLDSPSDATFMSNAQELETAVTGCYAKLWGMHQLMPYHMVLDVASDVGWDRDGSQIQAIGSGSHDARNTAILFFWQTLYQGIFRCNYVLENMERAKSVVSEDLYNKRRSEVRFLRAFYYHFLAELYGGVPLVLTPITLSEAQMARNSKEEVVNFILTELEECATSLPLENNPLEGRINRVAAWALASRVALYNKMWEISTRNAQKVMNLEGAQVVLSENFLDLFQYAGAASKEAILSVKYSPDIGTFQQLYLAFASRNGAGVSNKVPLYQLADSWECTDGLQIDESPLFNPKKPYSNRDPRLGYTLALSGSNFVGYQFETNGDSTSCWNYNTTPATRVMNSDATNAFATFTGICWRKYVDQKDRAGLARSTLSTNIIRYGEVLLNYAEAKIESNSIDQSVVDAINKVRQRPSVKMPPIKLTNQNELRNAVRRERKYELTGEGTRLFDIRRWKIAEKVMSLPVLGRMKKSYPGAAPKVDELGTSYYDNIPIASSGESSDFKMRTVELRKFNAARDYLWPIPDIELQTNKALVQNPGY